MKSVLFKLLFFLLITSFNTHSQTVVYDGLYGVEALLHLEDHVIYKGLYGYDALAHVEDDVIYKGMYGYDAIAHVEDDVISKKMYGYDGEGPAAAGKAEGVDRRWSRRRFAGVRVRAGACARTEAAPDI